ncbi:hypothetical protein ACFO3O_17440 [Dokdonia ponticola]|uniref:Uncharacterized protein n=1 Tax=Dokdonia ponticola TaxID=2041041 RepID=A0ABV9I049_9FLAO
MYRLKDIKPNELKDIPITHQQEIIHQTGSPLVLTDGYALIKKQTQHFTVDDILAKQADSLLFEILEKHRKEKTKASEIKESKGKEIPLLSKQAIRIRENERLRILKLLKLQLSLNPKSA